MEQLTRNVSAITESQKLDALKSHAPELLGLVNELKEKVKELRERVMPIRTMVTQMVTASEDVDDDIVDYLKVKQQMLLSYCISLTFYLYMKVQGQSIRDHPVMRQLLELRYAMEKMRGLDGKLKHQIDRLMKQSAGILLIDRSRHIMDTSTSTYRYSHTLPFNLPITYPRASLAIYSDMHPRIHPSSNHKS